MNLNTAEKIIKQELLDKKLLDHSPAGDSDFQRLYGGKAFQMGGCDWPALTAKDLEHIHSNTFLCYRDPDSDEFLAVSREAHVLTALCMLARLGLRTLGSDDALEDIEKKVKRLLKEAKEFCQDAP
jgi:hypothetical protein